MTNKATFEQDGRYTRVMTRACKETSADWNCRVVAAINEQRSAGDTAVKLFDGTNHDSIIL